MKKFISWRRVSTQKQKKSNLGLAAQLDIVQYWAKEEGGELVADYSEAYTGTDLAGCRELQKAIAHCKEIGATLIIAKTDRFRNDAEAISIYNKMGKNIYFCDCPSQDEFMIKLMFLLAAREAKTIGIRTKQALNVIKEKTARGETHISKNGNAIAHLGRPKGCKASDNAIEASRTACRSKALGNPNNIAFMKFMDFYEEQHGKITPNTDISPFTEQLQRLGYKTSTGLDFNNSRARSMVNNIRSLRC